MMKETLSDKNLIADKLAGKLKGAIRIYRLMVVLTGIFVIFWDVACLLEKYTPETSNPIGRIFALFLLTIFSYVLFLLAYTFSIKRKINKEDLEFQKTYNIALYEKNYEKRYKLGSSSVLLRIAKQQLLTKEFDEAERTLKRLQVERLSGFQKKSYDFYQQMIDFHKNGDNAYVESQANMLSNWEDKEKRVPSTFLSIFIGILILYSSWFFLGEDLLPVGFHFRYHFVLYSITGLWFAWSAVVCWLCYRLMCLWGRLNVLAAIARIFLRIVTIIAGIIVLLFVLIFGFFVPLFRLPVEMEEYEDGIILLQTQDYDPYTYYNRAVGPFLRKNLVDEEELNLPVFTEGDELTLTDGTDKDTSSANTYDSYANSIDAYDDNYEYWEDEYFETALRLESEMKTIRQYLIDAGDQANIVDDEVSCEYNAKGNLYLNLETGTDENGDYRKYIVYDRSSNNEQCDLFVYYLDRLSSDGQVENTEILNFFAVRISDGMVIPANKTSWSGMGSTAYRDATGE